MSRRNESVFLALALGLALALTLLYGCRAFDPEPVIVNLPPDTFVTGAAAETTGSLFQRHMYWYGSDADGEVVRYIWAITDSTIQDEETPDIDEEEARFDPCDDITTTEIEDWRVVGYTTRSDSTFIFTVDRGPVDSKDITFHVVAIDDRGGCDATPARLHFYNNSLGNPAVTFRVWTFETGQPRLRWQGNAFNGFAGSPEDGDHPFVGFARRYMVSWEGSSPNGPIAGYKFQPSADASLPFFPRDPDTGLATFGPDTSFVFANDTQPGALPPAGCDFGPDCPELRRFESGTRLLRVVALDVASVENIALAGELKVEINYAPETFLPLDPVQCVTVGAISEAPPIYPQYRVPDGLGGWQICTFAPGDTVPAGAYVVVRMTGYDRYEGRPGLSDSFCCDVVLADTSVTYQAQNEYFGRTSAGGIQNIRDGFSVAVPADTIGFLVGPFDYTFSGRTKDEHGRPDGSASVLRFVGGFPPRITSLSPTTGDTLILRWPSSPFGTRWDDNDIPYTVQPVNRYWDRTALRWVDQNNGDPPTSGSLFTFSLRFEGTNDPREPGVPAAEDLNKYAGGVRGWAYELFTDRDPENAIKQGGGRDVIDFFNQSPELNRLEYSGADGVEIFVPDLMWTPTLLQFFECGGQDENFRNQGYFTRRQLDRNILRVKGKVTTNGSRFPHWPLSVRPAPEGRQFLSTLPELGRETELTEEVFYIFLGIEDQSTGTRLRLWPDFEECIAP